MQESAPCPLLSRRNFVAGIATEALLCAQKRADIVIRIERARIEVAPGRMIATTTYNGTSPGPLIRMKEGDSSSVEIFNRTELPEYVHWHGFDLSAELDGTPEEGSLEVPPNGSIRYEITPL